MISKINYTYEVNYQSRYTKYEPFLHMLYIKCFTSYTHRV